ncbi:MAG: hypothetical protein ABFD50_01490, partial [Smithella sp.]
YSIKLNGKELRKNYRENKHVLDSNIIFWDLRAKSGANDTPGDKIGILWFTFNRKLTSSKKDDHDYGIIVRSKNIQMGNNDTFADQTFNSKDYVATYRELTQMLRGVYGELLINSPTLKDNARREWFKIDENSYYLKNIITDFMRRLHKYRYSASKYYNNAELNNKKRLKEALTDLVSVDTNSINVNTFNDEINEDNDSIDKKIGFQFADEDMPRESLTKRRAYEELMTLIYEFFKKERKNEIFLKLRAYIKRNYDVMSK